MQSDRIVRVPEPAPVAAAATEPATPAAPQSPATEPARPAVPANAPAMPVEGQLAPVRRGQALSQIAGGLARESGHSLEQTMLALLRANPEAFIRGNVNLLRQGAVLRVPQADELAQINAAEARAIVREHTSPGTEAYHGP